MSEFVYFRTGKCFQMTLNGRDICFRVIGSGGAGLFTIRECASVEKMEINYFSILNRDLVTISEI